MLALVEGWQTLSRGDGDVLGRNGKVEEDGRLFYGNAPIRGCLHNKEATVQLIAHAIFDRGGKYIEVVGFSAV